LFAIYRKSKVEDLEEMWLPSKKSECSSDPEISVAVSHPA
jgi:hypothetical protein